MFRRQPPPSKWKYTSTNQNSAIVNCLSYHARKSDSLRVPINTERSEKFFALHDNMVYNSGVVVRGCGRPWWCWWPPPRHVGIQFDFIRIFKISYMCILLEQFLNTQLDMYAQYNLYWEISYKNCFFFVWWWPVRVKHIAKCKNIYFFIITR